MVGGGRRLLDGSALGKAVGRVMICSSDWKGIYIGSEKVEGRSKATAKEGRVTLMPLL